MSDPVIYYVAVGLSVFFFVGLYVRDRPKRPVVPLPAKPKEPPRWHKWFDDPV